MIGEFYANYISYSPDTFCLFIPGLILAPSLARNIRSYFAQKSNSNRPLTNSEVEFCAGRKESVLELENPNVSKQRKDLVYRCALDAYPTLVIDMDGEENISPRVKHENSEFVARYNPSSSLSKSLN